MMKKLLSLILCFVFALFPFSVYCTAESPIEFVRINCASNMVNDTYFYLALKNGNHYLSVDDVEKFTGYRATSQKNQIEFSGLNTTVRIDVSFNFADKNWVPFESSLEKLDTSISQVASGLIIKAKWGSVNDLYGTIDHYLQEPNLSALTALDMDNWQGNLGIAGSFVYGVLSNFNLFDRISGNYKTEQYKSIFSSLVDVDRDKTAETLLKEQQKINDYINKISKLDIADSFEDLDNVDETVELFCKWGISTQAITAYKTTQAAKPFFDPVEAVYKNLVKDSSFLSDVGISGTDIISQMKIYNYVDSAINCSNDIYRTLEYTFFDDNGKQVESNLPIAFSSCVSDVHKYYSSTDCQDALSLLLKTEMHTILRNTAAKGVDSVLVDALGPYGWITKLTLKANSLLIDSIVGNADESMEFVEKTKLLNQLQNSVYTLYLKYRNTKGKELNAKYAAIMYIKLYQVYKDLYKKANGEEIAGMDQNALSKILSLSDYDIATTIKNKKISVEGLKKINSDEYLNTFEISESTPVYSFTGVINKITESGYADYYLTLNKTINICDTYAESKTVTCNKLFFYPDSDINGNYDYECLVGKKCTVKASLENFRGADDIFLLEPKITVNGAEAEKVKPINPDSFDFSELLGKPIDNAQKKLGKNFEDTYNHGGKCYYYKNFDVELYYKSETKLVFTIAVYGKVNIGNGLKSNMNYSQLVSALPNINLKYESYYSEIDSRNEYQASFVISNLQYTFIWTDNPKNNSPESVVLNQSV